MKKLKSLQSIWSFSLLMCRLLEHHSYLTIFSIFLFQLTIKNVYHPFASNTQSVMPVHATNKNCWYVTVSHGQHLPCLEFTQVRNELTWGELLSNEIEAILQNLTKWWSTCIVHIIKWYMYWITIESLNLLPPLSSLSIFLHAR